MREHRIPGQQDVIRDLYLILREGVAVFLHDSR
jgi:hypothetical protein